MLYLITIKIHDIFSYSINYFILVQHNFVFYYFDQKYVYFAYTWYVSCWEVHISVHIFVHSVQSQIPPEMFIMFRKTHVHIFKSLSL